MIKRHYFAALMLLIIASSMLANGESTTTYANGFTQSPAPIKVQRPSSEIRPGTDFEGNMPATTITKTSGVSGSDLRPDTSKEILGSNQAIEKLYQNTNNGGLWVEIYGPKNPPVDKIVNYNVFVTSAKGKSSEGTGSISEIRYCALYFAYPDDYIETYPPSDFLTKGRWDNVEHWYSTNKKESLKAYGTAESISDEVMSTLTRVPFAWLALSSLFPSMPIPPENSVFFDDNEFDTLMIPFTSYTPLLKPIDEASPQISPPDDLENAGPDNAICFIVPTKFTDSRPTYLHFFVATQEEVALDQKLTNPLPFNYHHTGEITVPVVPTGAPGTVPQGKVIGRWGLITAVSWPAKDTYDYSETIPVKVDFKNIGSEPHSFWAGYSVQDSSGKWWDMPPQQATVTQPGESGSLELKWLPTEMAPQGAYNATVALWEGRNFDTGLMEGEFDSRNKDNAFHLNPVQPVNVPQSPVKVYGNNDYDRRKTVLNSFPSAKVPQSAAELREYMGNDWQKAMSYSFSSAKVPQDQGGASDFTGTWINDDPDAVGVGGVAGLSRIEIQPSGNSLDVTIWAKGKTKDASLDTVRVSCNDNPLKVTHTFSWFTATNTLTLLSNNALLVNFEMRCTDGTDRVFQKEYHFHRS